MIEGYRELIEQILFSDAAHAWVLVSILYLTGSLLIHALLVGSVKKAAKRISSKNAKSLNDKYISRSLAGWFFYCLSWLFFVLFWYASYFHQFDLQDLTVFFISGSFLTFLFAVIFHLAAYAASCLDQIKVLEDQQLTP